MKYIEVKDYKNFNSSVIANNLPIPLNYTKSSLSLNASQFVMRTLGTIISDKE